MIPGYTKLESLAETPLYSLIRAKGDTDSHPYLLKIVHPKLFNDHVDHQFQNEYHLLQTLKCANITTPVALNRLQDTIALISKNEVGITLHDHLQNKPIDLAQFLSLAISLTKIINDLHHHRHLYAKKKTH